MVMVSPCVVVLFLGWLFQARSELTRLTHIGVFDLQPVNPKRFWNPCSNVTDGNCVCGLASVAARVRELRKAAKRAGVSYHVVYTGDVGSKLVQFHSQHVGLNLVAMNLLQPSAHWPEDTLLLTGGRATLPVYIRDADRMGVPLVYSNLDLRLGHQSANFIRRYVILDGRVALLTLIDPARTVVPLEPPESFLHEMIAGVRRVDNVTVVGLFVVRFETTTVYPWGDFDLDFVVLGRPLVGGSEVRSHVTYQNRTAFVHRSTNPYTALTLDLDLSGGPIVVVGSSEMDLRTPLTKSLLEDVDYQRDAEVVQGWVVESKATNPVVATSPTPMPDDANADRTRIFCRSTECELGTLHADIFLWANPRADVALVNGGALRSGWDAGQVRLGNLHAAYRFIDNLCLIPMTGVGLWRALVHGIQGLRANDPTNTSGISGLGKFPQIAGMQLEFNPALTPPHTLTSVHVFNKHTRRWEPIHHKRVYHVETNRYICSGGDDYNLTAEATGVPEVSEIELHTFVAEWLGARKGVVSPYVDQRIRYSSSMKPLILRHEVQSDCAPHTYWDMDGCQPCPSPLWQPEPGQTECVERGDPEMVVAWWVWILSVTAAGLACVLFVIVGVLGFRLCAKHRELVAKRRELHRQYDSEVIVERVLDALVEMRLHELDYLRALENPSPIQANFVRIVSILEEYRHFLPQSALERADGDSELEAGLIYHHPLSDVSSQERPSSFRRRSTKQSTGSHDDVSVLSTGSERERRAMEFPGSPKWAGVSPAACSEGRLMVPQSQFPSRAESPVSLALALRLSKRTVAVAVFNIAGFTHLLDELTLTEILVVHGRVMELITAKVRQAKGVSDHFVGDKILAHWNALQTVGLPGKKACDAAWGAVHEAHTVREDSMEVVPGVVALTVGVAEGVAFVGNMGWSGVRKFTVMGPSVSRAHVLERMVKEYPRAAVLVDDQAVIGASHHYQMCYVDRLQLPSLGVATSQTFLVAKIVAAEGTAEDAEEWMYELRGRPTGYATKVNDAVEKWATRALPAPESIAPDLEEAGVAPAFREALLDPTYRNYQRQLSRIAAC